MNWHNIYAAIQFSLVLYYKPGVQLFLKSDYALQREPRCDSLTHLHTWLLTHSHTHSPFHSHNTLSHTYTRVWVWSTKILQDHLIPDEEWVAHRWMVFFFIYRESVKGLMILTGSETQCVFWVTVTLDYQGTWWQKKVGIIMKSSRYQCSVITTSSVTMESASTWAW